MGLITNGKCNLDIYNTELFYFVGEDLNECKEAAKRHFAKRFPKLEPLSLEEVGCTTNGQMVAAYGQIYILIKTNDTKTITNEMFGVIAHEAAHAAMHIFEIRGIIPDTDNDEPLAYLVGYIASECMKTMMRHCK